MLETIIQNLNEVSMQPAGLLFAFLLGLVSAAASACCTLPAMGMLVGYCGTRTEDSRKSVVRSALYFTVGTIVSLMIIGGIAGFIGQIVQTALGRYWQLFAALAAVVLGLATMKVLPFKLSFGRPGTKRKPSSALGMVIAGLLLGGIVAVSSLCCNPGIFIVIGVAVLQGKIVWSILLLGMFAVGFGTLLGLVMMGFSLGKFSLAAKGADSVIRWGAGLLLVGVGLYFLITF